MLEDYKNNKFYDLVSNLTKFSHAYLFEVNSMQEAFPLVLAFAKKIVCPHNYANSSKCVECQICYQIDNNIFDDIYVVNPDAISIKNEDIEQLLKYFETKSLRENGKRVYIICGFERLSPLLSNKILKFLEEPKDNIYGLLITENANDLLPTIKSRCQLIHLDTDKVDYDHDKISNMTNFLHEVIKKNGNSIAFVNDYWYDTFTNRQQFLEYFNIIEYILLKEIHVRYANKVLNFEEVNLEQLLKILEITSHLKKIIKKNVNLNLLLDRYIIEITRGVLCKES